MRYSFVHVPKTGGISILKAIGWKTDHIPAYELDGFRFGFVRNPYDRLLSTYTYFKEKKQKLKARDWWVNRHMDRYNTFEDFVLDMPNRLRLFEQRHLKLQTHYTHYGYKYNLLQFTGRFENLEEDFEKVCNMLNIKHKPLPHLNKSNHVHWENAYTEEMKRLVYEHYFADFKLLDYKKEF